MGMLKMNKECHLGKEGMALYRIYCNDCECWHPQWRYPCNNRICDHGKVRTLNAEYAICETCQGKCYL